MKILKEEQQNMVNIDSLVDDVTSRITQIHPDFDVVKINDNTFRVYMNKKSVLTADLIISVDNYPYAILTDYMGMKDVIDFTLDDSDSLIQKIEDILKDLNLTEREIIFI